MSASPGSASHTMQGYWADDTSVFFTSFWGWDPETWATVGWSNDSGRTRRDRLLKHLTDPFIAVCYVTKSGNLPAIDPDLKGKIAGFYLVSHETGDRDKFTHPIHHSRSPEKWRHSLRAVRAFSYLPEYRMRAEDFYRNLAAHARAVASLGEIIKDPQRIAVLRGIPCKEVSIYSPSKATQPFANDDDSHPGWVRAGPANTGDYIGAAGGNLLPRHLYALCLAEDTSAFLGYPAEGRCIYKIRLSVSPELRRQQIQKAMPTGAFHWGVERTTAKQDSQNGFSFDAAVAGEYAMNRYLAGASE